MRRSKRLTKKNRYRRAYTRDTLISPIIVFVSNFEKCLRFYRTVFNLPVLHKRSDWAELDATGFVLSIHGGYRGTPRRQKPLALHFLTKDIEKSILMIRKYGGTVGRLRDVDFRPDEFVTAREARFRDPDGNEYELRQVVSIG